MLLQKRNKSRTIASFIVCVILIAGTFFILLFRQRILDQITVWQFKPAQEISILTDRLGLNNNGKLIFYASQPELDSSNYFNKVCNRIEYTTSILGCYSNFRIYIYNVTDVKLDGIREVTAAHEMLHAVFQRMSDAEKTELGVLLEAEYKKLENDKDFVGLIDFYARTEPGERINELHSVIGTSVASIDPALEAHYSQYFSSRQLVVQLYVKYNGVFKDLNDRAKILIDQLNVLSTDIPTRSSQYNSDVQTLNSDIKLFNNRVESGYFKTQWQFDNERAILESRAAGINLVRDGINTDISNYNSLLIEYNSIASESKKLSNSIDSTLMEAPSV